MAHAIGMTIAGAASKSKRGVCSLSFFATHKNAVFLSCLSPTSSSRFGSLSLLRCSQNLGLQAHFIEQIKATHHPPDHSDHLRSVLP